MDTYLQIATEVLESERRPLSPRAILEIAYKRSIVPNHLYGRTQHKTLQARISEDIISRREHSLFFRTKPGRFFLRKFLADQRLPEEFRTVFPARRRLRELIRSPALALPRSVLNEIASENTPIEPSIILTLFDSNMFCYGDPRQRDEGLVYLRSFVSVFRGCSLLSYRVGRYRDDRDTFMSKRSVGFSTFVSMEDQTLFNLGTLGIVDAGLRAAKIDLDIPDVSFEENLGASLSCFIWSTKSAGSTDLLAVIDFDCPKWFEPLKRRLALNDLCWLDASKPVNDIDDFDPWSQLVLLAYFKTYFSRASDSEADNPIVERRRRRLSEVSD